MATVRLHHAGRELAWTCPSCRTIVGETYEPVDPRRIGIAVALFTALGLKNPKAWKRYPESVSCPDCQEVFKAEAPPEPRPRVHKREPKRNDCD